jgi:hypothetical protein
MVSSLEEAFKDWSWLFDAGGAKILETSCIGDVVLRNSQGETLILDVVGGELRSYSETEKEMLENQDHLIAKLEAAGLKLEPGKCYGMKPTEIFKPFEAENMYVATLNEYVSFMGYFHGQIKDLPDGTTVRLKVKW